MNIALNDLASIRDPSIPQSPKKKWDDSQKVDEDLRKSLERSVRSKASTIKSAKKSEGRNSNLTKSLRGSSQKAPSTKAPEAASTLRKSRDQS